MLKLGFILAALLVGLLLDVIWQPLAPVSAMARSADQYLSDLHRQGRFNGTVLMARGDQVIFSQGYGPGNNEQTRFRIGSLTKQFTAVALLQLVERGQLKLDDKLCAFIKDCPPGWQPITLLHLLTHTSGLPQGLPTPEYQQASATATSAATLVPYFKEVGLVFPPGTQFEYNNGNYILLGYVIGQVTGLSYEDFVQTSIIAPLKLSGTGFECSGPGCATTNVPEQPINWKLLNPAGGLYSTARDLYQWDRALYGEEVKLLSPANLDRLFQPRVGDYQNGYGVGWYITRYQERTLDWHNGEMPGFHASLWRWPSDQTVMISLANSDATSPNLINQQLSDIWYELPGNLVSRWLIWPVALLLLVLAGFLGGALGRQVLRQPRRWAWQFSRVVIGWWPLAGVGLALAMLALDHSPWRITSFAPFQTARLVETLLPLLTGLQAANLFVPDDETALEITLACPRLLGWVLLERLGLLLAIQFTIGLSLGLTGWLLTGGQLGIALTGWIAPTLFLSGLAVCATVVSRLSAFGAGIVMIIWFAMMMGFDNLLAKYWWLWPFDLYLQPDNPQFDYWLNRLSLATLGLVLIALALYFLQNEEWVLLGPVRSKFKVLKPKEEVA